MRFWQLKLERLGEYLPPALVEAVFGREDIDWMPYSLESNLFQDRYRLLDMYN